MAARMTITPEDDAAIRYGWRPTSKSVVVTVHRELAEGEQHCWWCESEQLPNWTAAAGSFSELRELWTDAIPFLAVDAGIEVAEVRYRFAP